MKFKTKILSLLKKNKTNPEKNENIENLLDNKIISAIEICEKDKNTALEEIEQIKRWAQEAICEIFSISSKFWYNEIDEYENIKNQSENADKNQQLIRMCDEIIKGYRNQINLREAKIKLCDVLIEEYLKSKQKLIETEKKINTQNNEEHKLSQLNQHIDRLKMLDEDVSNLENSILNSQKLNIVDFDLGITENELSEKEEINKQLLKLSELYTDLRFHNNSEIFKNEIEKIITEIRKRK